MSVYHEIKWMYQRVRYGYDDTFLWDIGYSVAELLDKTLPKYFENMNGYPSYIGSMDEWRAIIREIIDGMQAARKLNEYDFSKENLEELVNKADKGMLLFAKYYRDIWD